MDVGEMRISGGDGGAEEEDDDGENTDEGDAEEDEADESGSECCCGDEDQAGDGAGEDADAPGRTKKKRKKKVKKEKKKKRWAEIRAEREERRAKEKEEKDKPKKPQLRPSLLLRVKPANIDEEMAKFFDSDCSYNPPFTMCSCRRPTAYSRLSRRASAVRKSTTSNSTGRTECPQKSSPSTSRTTAQAGTWPTRSR